MASASGEFDRKTEAKIQQMIKERRVKIHEVKRSVELSKKDADTEIEDSVQVFTALISCIQRSQAELIDVIGQKHKTVEKQAEGFIKEMEQEIIVLEKRISELSHAEDHLLQNFTSIKTPLPTKDWTKVNVQPSSCVGTLRTAVVQLENTLSQEMNKTWDVDLRKIQQYVVDVTLDPDTAHPYLILSDDGKQVSFGHIWKNCPENKERFSACVSVLGKQGFTSGRFYYEVHVGWTTDWDVGVARESINRKGDITMSTDDGFWTIWLRNGTEYKALSCPPVLLSVREGLQKVGVLVDYEEGLVSFYDAETRVHLYSFTGCTFTERLYPYFCPGMNRNALIISPVNQRNEGQGTLNRVQ